MSTWCVAMFYGPIGILLVFIMCDDVLIICFETLRLRWGFGGLLAFAGAYSCLVEIFLFGFISTCFSAMKDLNIKWMPIYVDKAKFVEPCEMNGFGEAPLQVIP